MISRNEQICVLYREGLTQEELAEQFEVTKVRIGQILKKAGLTKEDRPDMTITSNRTKFTGIHLTEAAKLAVKEEAKREGISMSAFIAALVLKELKDRGIDCEIATYLKEEDVKLPL
jgi:transcriptional regulator with XRE-family HTH domain